MATDTKDRSIETGADARDPARRGFDDLVDRSSGAGINLKSPVERELTDQRPAATQEPEETDSPRKPSLSKSLSPMGRLQAGLGALWSGNRKRKVILGGGGGLVSILIFALMAFGAPTFAVIHFKEILVDDFNYVRDALDDSQVKTLSKKLEGRATNRCNFVTDRIPAVCRFSRVSNHQQKMMTQAGITVEGEPPRICPLSGDKAKKYCGIKPTHYTFKGERMDAKEFSKRMREGKDRELTEAVRKGYRPIYVAWAAKPFDKLRQKHNLSKETPGNKSSDEIKKDHNNNVKQTSKGVDGGKVTERDGKYYDDEGKEMSAAEAQATERVRGLSEEHKKLKPGAIALETSRDAMQGALSAGINGATKVPCRAYGIIKKTAIGMSQHAMAVFMVVGWFALTGADAIKLAMGNPYNPMSVVGKILFTPDAAGNNAFQHPAWQEKVYHKPRRSLRDSEKSLYSWSFGIAGEVMTKAMTSIKQYTGNKPDVFCNIATSPWVQTGGILVGIVAGIFTLGGASVAGAVASGAASAAMGVAAAVAMPMLTSMIDGSLVPEGVSGGAFAGFAMLGVVGMHAQNSQLMGLRIQSKEAAISQTQQMLADARKRAEFDRQTLSPFDISSPHTLVGSTVRSIAPTLASVRNGVSLSSLPSVLLGNIAGRFESRANAANEDLEFARYRNTACQNAWSEGATDQECAQQYATHYGMEPEENVDWLEQNGFIDNDYNLTEKALGDEGGNYFKDCVDREVPQGFVNEVTRDPGTKCIRGKGGEHEKLFDRFALFNLTKENLDLMDGDPNPSLNAEGSSATSAETPTAGGTSEADVEKFKKSVRNGRIPSNILCKIGAGFNEEMLYCSAQQMFLQLNADYKAKFNKNICITDSYRSYEDQVRVKRERGNFAAEPGTSNHGFGTALDLCNDGPGDTLRFNDTEYNWLRDNGPTKGWFHPKWARPGGSDTPEPWHFEFQGIGANGE